MKRASNDKLSKSTCRGKRKNKNPTKTKILNAAVGPSLIHDSQVVSQTGNGSRCGGKTSEYASLRRVATLASRIYTIDTFSGSKFTQ